jgi:5'-nucleotidase
MKQIVQIDLDGVMVDYEEQIRNGTLHKNERGFFLTMRPIEGAIEAFHKLHYSQKYDPYILSTAPWSNEWSWMEKRIWVDTFIGEKAFKKLTLTHNKQMLRGDFLIDDRPFNGAESFEGEWIQMGSEKFPDWDAVLNHLEV